MALTDWPGCGPGDPVPTPRMKRFDENAWMVWTLRVSSIGSCSSNLITPLPAWTFFVRARIDAAISRDSYQILWSGTKTSEISWDVSKITAVSLISCGENTPGRSANPIFSDLKIGHRGATRQLTVRDISRWLELGYFREEV